MPFAGQSAPRGNCFCVEKSLCSRSNAVLSSFQTAVFIHWKEKHKKVIRLDDQKIENLLNLALDVTPEERRKSERLEVGYDEADEVWEVIVRYSGDLLGSALEDWRIVLLSGGYAIVTLPQEEIDQLASLPQVEYVEKPKRLFFSVDAGRAASCISPVQTGDLELFGEGILVAVIDSGVDYFHPDFRKEDGRTRIVAMWDQTAVLDDDTGQRVPPSGFLQGLEYTEEDLNQALAANSREEALKLVPEFDAGGHGTQVLGIAAGNGRASGGRYRGVAPQSELIVVKMGMPKERSFPRTTELMQAVEYVIRKAEQLGKPVVLNLSFGNVYGSHEPYN